MEVKEWFPFGKGYTGDVIGHGMSSIVYSGRIEDEVTKYPRTSEWFSSLRTEKAVYDRLTSSGQHPHILRYNGSFDEGDGVIGVRLAHAKNGQLSRYLYYHGEEPTMSRRVRWAEQISKALQHVHSKNIIHSDVHCNNVFLDEAFDAYLGDFSGSSIDGSEPEACASTSHTPVPDRSPQKMDIFALGSVMYHLLTNHKPYDGETEGFIEGHFERGKYPSIDHVQCPKRLHDTLYGCWNGKYENMDEVISDLMDKASTEENNRQTSIPYLARFNNIRPGLVVAIIPLFLIGLASHWPRRGGKFAELMALFRTSRPSVS